MTERHDASQRRSADVADAQPGFYRLRLVRDGWQVPCRILHENGQWQAEIDGELREAHPQPEHADGLAAIWHGAMIVTESEYRWAVATREHARAHEPDHPSLHPFRPIEPMRLKPLSLPRRL